MEFDEQPCFIWEYGATVAQAAVNREVVGSNPSIPATNHKGLQTL